MKPTPHRLALAALALIGATTAHAQTQLERVEIVGVSPVPGAGVARDLIPANVQTARAADIAALRDAVVAGVRERYGITLVPEPVQVGF